MVRHLRISTERPPLGGVFGPLDEERTARVLGHLQLADDRLMALRDALAEQTGAAWKCEGVQLVVGRTMGYGMISGYVEALPA